MSESTELTNKVIDYIYRQGGYAWRASSVGIFDQKAAQFRAAPKKGVADVLGCLPPNGKLLVVEIKIGKDHLSQEQEGFLKNIEHVGGVSFVAKDFESFKKWFDWQLVLIQNSPC